MKAKLRATLASRTCGNKKNKSSGKKRKRKKGRKKEERRKEERKEGRKEIAQAQRAHALHSHVAG